MAIASRYEYSGYLRSVMHAPDPRAHERVDHVYFGPDDLLAWNLTDRRTEKEWQHVPVHRERTPEGVRLEGRFEDVRRIDSLGEHDPSFWVALSSVDSTDGRFPIDLGRWPLVELTYRCLTPRAHPVWAWTYPGGEHVDKLPVSSEWRTVVRRIPHFGFPEQITGVTFRLYSGTRTTEALEIASLRFRAATSDEMEACNKSDAVLLQQPAPAHYPLLENFLPIGCAMNARTAMRVAEHLEISFRDYWRLAFEDQVRMHHNAIALENISALSEEQWREVLGLAESFGLRILAMHDWPVERLAREGRKWVDAYVRPYVHSSALLAWTIVNEPSEREFRPYLDARALFEQADPEHPLAAMLRTPDAFPLFGRHFAAAGMSWFRSHSPWDLYKQTATHLALSRGQQLWTMIPGFVWGTDTPAWSSCPEMRLLVNLAFAGGTRGLFTYTYHNEPIWLGGYCQRSLTGPFLTFSDLWTELGQRAERFHALAPLLLQARPVELSSDQALILSSLAHPRSRLGAEHRPADGYALAGPDFRLYYIVNNDIDEVTAVNIEVPQEALHGQQVYDVTDFARSRQWTPAPLRRHIEMFPGQGQILLVAPPEVCTRLRNQMIESMIRDDQRVLAVDLALARRYDLEVGDVQRIVQEVGIGDPLQDAARMREARSVLMNRIYDTPQITAARSKLIEVSAALCACDGALCRLFGRGKIDLAHELGLKIMPLARELTDLRIKLRRGRGPEVLEPAQDLARRTVRMLGEVRSRL